MLKVAVIDVFRQIVSDGLVCNFGLTVALRMVWSCFQVRSSHTFDDFL